MKYKLVALLIVLALLTAGCAMRSVPEMGVPAPMEAPAGYEKSANSSTSVSGGEVAVAAAQDMPKMIVYTGEISLVVKDTVKVQEDITQMVEGMEGYVSNSNSSAYGSGLMRINMTLRLPADRFDEMMAALRAMAMEVTQESTDSQDVTQEYVDLESRLRALEAKADRLEELMKQAEDTEAVLAVYQELSQTEQEIEQTKGRMQYLERSAAMATITVSLTPDELSQPVEIAGWRPAGVAKQAFEALVAVFQFLLKALIWLVILIVPVAVFLGLLFYVLIRLLRLIFKRRRHKQAATSPPSSSAKENAS